MKQARSLSKTIGKASEMTQCSLPSRFLSLDPIPEEETSVIDIANDDCNRKCLKSPGSPTSVHETTWLPSPRRRITTTRTGFRCSSPSSQLTRFGTSMLEFVNKERVVRDLKPLQSSPLLNQLATEHAVSMANARNVFHSVPTIDDLKTLLLATAPHQEVAENIQRGDTIHGMYNDTMDHTNAINRSNVLSTYFTECGCGVAVGTDGKLYSCQLFRG
jgi:uncharacterized protein YkwD